MERSWRGVALVVLVGAFSLVPTVERATATIPRGLTVMLTGDSASASIASALQARLEARLGWHLAQAEVSACSLLGDPLAWPDGTYKGDKTHCDVVVPRQNDVLASHPEIVLWWDRLSQMPFMTREDPPRFMLSGTTSFWRYRQREVRERARHFIDAGATIVFLATEPMGTGVFHRCKTWDETRICSDWVRFRTRHYLDVTRRWNRMLHAFAVNHPRHSVYISMSGVICHQVVSPCDDSIGDVYARPEGTHYKDAGAAKAANAIVHRMRMALYPNG